MLQVEKLLNTVLLVGLFVIVWFLHLLGDSFDTLLEVVGGMCTCGGLTALFSQLVERVDQFFFFFLFLFLLLFGVFFFFLGLGLLSYGSIDLLNFRLCMLVYGLV